MFYFTCKCRLYAEKNFLVISVFFYIFRILDSVRNVISDDLCEIEVVKAGGNNNYTKYTAGMLTGGQAATNLEMRDH